MKKISMDKKRIQYPFNCKSSSLDFRQRYLIILIQEILQSHFNGMFIKHLNNMIYK